MSTRNPLAVLTLAAPFFLVACGGGGQSTDTAATTATTMGAGGGASSTAGGPAAGSGSISGKVTFAGTPPAPDKIKTSADPKCQEMHKDGLERHTVEVKDGGVANTLVYVKNAPAGATSPTEEATLDQQGCMYHPTMLAVRTGQPIKIKNSDDTLHNIHPRPTKNAEFNIGQPRKGMETTRTFDQEEVLIPVGCDVHPWMRSYIAVLSHPYFAVTKEDGSFEIKGLPAGDYEVEANHPKLKTTTAKVTVKDGDSAKLDLPFKS
jgi:plastocyanin